eukprot:2201251-Prymnesium_polylepis.1
MDNLATTSTAGVLMDMAEHASEEAAPANQDEVAALAEPEPEKPTVFVHNWAMNKRLSCLTGDFRVFKNSIIVQVTNQPEVLEKGTDVYKEVKAVHLKGTAVHNEQVIAKEMNNIFAQQAGLAFSSSTRRGPGEPTSLHLV